MKKCILRTIFALVTLCVIGQANAIPAFARKYQLSCQTCHNPSPRLKPFGDEFAGNGFKMPNQEAPRYFVPTGDQSLSLLRELPLAVRLDGFMKVDTDADQKFDFSAPYIVKLMSGGELAKNLSYYFYFYFDETGHVAGIEDAFLIFNNLFGVDFDLYVGQFAVSDPLYKNEIRLTLSEYKIYKAAPGISRTNLSYDKGVMLTYGMKTGTDITLELVNGSGLGEAEGDGKFFDRDKYKNVMGRISQNIGDNLRVGVFGYLGKELFDNRGVPGQIVNKINYWGPDASLTFGDKFELNLQYLFRTDSEIFETWDWTELTAKKNVKTQGGLAELIFMPKGDESKWYAAGLVNYIKSDFKDMNYTSASLHVGYMLRRNLRLAAEYTLYETSVSKTSNRFSVGFVTAF